jgi:hypothetical protein
MEPVPEHIPLPKRPKKLPNVVAYSYLGDLMLLEGKDPKQALVGAPKRKIVRRTQKKRSKRRT